MRAARLGDDIDDFCVKCKRIMNHAVVSLVDDQPAKVRCRTCHNDHDYRHEQPPPPKVDSRKAALFNQVLDNVTARAPEPVAAEPVAPEPVAAEPVAAEPPPAEETAAPAPKTRARKKAQAK